MEHSGSLSRLFYHGTSVEVQLGDRVKLKRFLRRALDGTVCYIPGVSPKNPHLEYEVKEDGLYVREWAIRTDDGAIWSMGYSPPGAQPNKRVLFVARGTGGELRPDERLD